MSKAMQLVGLILLGIFTLVILNLMNDVRSTGELDYYLLQEVTEASMYDAVDLSFYRETGLLKVDRDMFLESFNRRFAQSVSNNRAYSIRILDFNETPPKVSVEVTASTIATVKGEVASVTTKVDGIIESIYEDYIMSVPQGGIAGVGDTERPKIQLITETKIKLTDNVALEKYCLGHIKGDLNDINFECDVWKTNVSGKRSYDLDFTNYEFDETKLNNGYKKAVIVYDRAGNWALNTIVYNGPSVSYCFYGNFGEAISQCSSTDNFDGDLKIEAFDLINTLKSYSVKVNGREVVSGNFKKVKDGQATARISGFYKNYITSSTRNITITVKNDSNSDKSTGSITFDIIPVKVNSPSITYSVINKGQKKMKINLSDTDGDLYYYEISNSATPNLDVSSGNLHSVKDGVSGVKTASVDYSYTEDKVFYIHAVDSLQNTYTKKVDNLKASYDYVVTSCKTGYYLDGSDCKKTTINYNECLSDWQDKCNGTETTVCSTGYKNYYTCVQRPYYYATTHCTTGYSIYGKDCCKFSQSGAPIAGSCIGQQWDCNAHYAKGGRDDPGRCTGDDTTLIYKYNQKTQLNGYSCTSNGTQYCDGTESLSCSGAITKVCPNNNFGSSTSTDNNQRIYGCKDDGSTPDTVNKVCDFYFEGETY